MTVEPMGLISHLVTLTARTRTSNNRAHSLCQCPGCVQETLRKLLANKHHARTCQKWAHAYAHSQDSQHHTHAAPPPGLPAHTVPEPCEWARLRRAARSPLRAPARGRARGGPPGSRPARPPRRAPPPPARPAAGACVCGLPQRTPSASASHNGKNACWAWRSSRPDVRIGNQRRMPHTT